MQPTVNRSSPIPLYHQIAEALRYQIATARLRSGDSLPLDLRGFVAHKFVGRLKRLEALGRPYREVVDEVTASFRNAIAVAPATPDGS